MTFLLALFSSLIITDTPYRSLIYIPCLHSDVLHLLSFLLVFSLSFVCLFSLPVCLLTHNTHMPTHQLFDQEMSGSSILWWALSRRCMSALRLLCVLWCEIKVGCVYCMQEREREAQKDLSYSKSAQSLVLPICTYNRAGVDSVVIWTSCCSNLVLCWISRIFHICSFRAINLCLFFASSVSVSPAWRVDQCPGDQ